MLLLSFIIDKAYYKEKSRKIKRFCGILCFAAEKDAAAGRIAPKTKPEPAPPDPPEESRCKVIPFEGVG